MAKRLESRCLVSLTLTVIDRALVDSDGLALEFAPVLVLALLRSVR
jgi:hypothetical protein